MTSVKEKLENKDEKDKLEYKEYLASEGESMKNGPISKRSCTDIPCCILFIAFIAAMVAASAYGYQNGDPYKLLIGWDSNSEANADGSPKWKVDEEGNSLVGEFVQASRGCGFSPETLDYPKLYFPRLPDASTLTSIMVTVSQVDVTDTSSITESTDDIFSFLDSGVCVKECPTTETTLLEMQTICMATTKMNYYSQTRYDESNASSGSGRGGNSGSNEDAETFYYKNCMFYTDLSAYAVFGEAGTEITNEFTSELAPFRFDTEDIAGKFCLPDVTEIIPKDVIDKIKTAFIEKVYGEGTAKVVNDVFAAWPVIIASIGIAFIAGYIFLFLLQLIGGCLIWLFFICCVASSIFAGYYAFTLSNSEEYENDPTADYIRYSAYGLWGVAGLFCLILCCCYSQLKLGIAVFNTTVDFTKAHCCIFILPTFTMMIQFVWFMFWIVSFVMVFSIGEVTQREPPLDFTTEIMWEDQTRYILIIQVFGLLWVMNFFIGCQQFVIACSACVWYFNCKGDTGGSGSICKSIWWLTLYHQGSIAFGSCVIAIAQMIRLVFEFYANQVRKGNPDNKCIKCCLCLTGYCLYCVEKCIKFITKNAYIQVALSNGYFCKSAWRAFALILSNAGRFGATATIGSIYQFFGTMAIGSMTGFSAYLILGQSGWVEVSSPLPGAIACLIVGLFIGSAFMAIYAFASDAILQSFLLGESLNLKENEVPEGMKEFAEHIEANKDNKGCC